MALSVHYKDKTLRNAAVITGTAAVSSLGGAGVQVVGGEERDAFFWLVGAVFFIALTYFYRTAIAVEVAVGPGGITKNQGLALGWHADWPQVQDLIVLDMAPQRLVVVSDVLPPRRGLNEWPVRKKNIPKRARTLLATPEFLEAVRDVSGRDITVQR